jgi:ABC-type phosphate transport system permease subunit
MEDRTKYILIGIVIGIAIGIAVFYLLESLRIIRPFGLSNFTRSGNFTNFTRPGQGT